MTTPDNGFISEVEQFLDRILDDVGVVQPDITPADLIVTTDAGTRRVFSPQASDVEVAYEVVPILRPILNLAASRPETRLLIAGRLLAEVAFMSTPDEPTDDGAPPTKTALIALIAFLTGCESVVDDANSRLRAITEMAEEDDLDQTSELDPDDEGEPQTGCDDDAGAEGTVVHVHDDLGATPTAGEGTLPVKGRGHPQYSKDVASAPDGSLYEDEDSGVRYVKRDGLWVPDATPAEPAKPPEGGPSLDDVRTQGHPIYPIYSGDL
jgi:hypothetical protein